MLSSSNISGSIPAVLSTATRLVQFKWTAIRSPAPFHLQIFFAWDAKLAGSIPVALSGCESLPADIFRLIYNDISGAIPPEIGGCTSLVRLRLVGNKISGEIPKEIGLLTNLSFLDRLSGLVPREIGNCKFGGEFDHLCFLS